MIGLLASAHREPSSGNIGRYTLLGELASGGMATVLLGRMDGPAGFSLTVAIKRLHEQFLEQPEFREMLCDEARLAGRVRHPNVVPIIDVVDERGELSLIMEYVRGESLGTLLRAARKRTGVGAPAAIASAIVLDVLEGLHAAHEACGDRGEPLGIVHRDVSPQNVLVGVDGVARVLDFGIAKAAGRLHETLNGVVKGKTSYMSPEQARGRDLDRRADVYAAGVVMWEALTGRRLFTGAHHVAILMKVFDEQPKAPSTLVRDLPPALDAVILRALAKAPAERYATAKEFAVALEGILPPAAPRVVGEWVRDLAAHALEMRARLEEDATIPTPPANVGEAIRSQAPSSAADLEAAPTETMVGGASEALPLERFGSRRAWLVALAAVLLLVGGGVALRRRALGHAQVDHERTAAASPAGVPDLPTSPVPSPSPSPPASDAPTASAPLATAAPIPSPPRLNRRRPAARAAGSTNAKPACDPPYRIDDQGIFVPKPECL